MVHMCSEYDEPASKRRCGCSRAWYCSKRCQKDAWVHHIFDCNPRREINTADYLALAVHEDLFPDDLQTLEDYGFTRAFTADNKQKLFGLYTGLIRYIGVKPLRLHIWQISGTLTRQIKAAYEALPANSRGGYYPWFFYVLDNSVPTPADHHSDSLKCTWAYTGGSPSDTVEKIQAQITCQQANMLHILQPTPRQMPPSSKPTSLA